jgi:hypothetical protein
VPADPASLMTKQAKRIWIAFAIIGVILSLNLTQPNAQNETARVLEAVNPQIAALRKCWINAAVYFATNTCDPAEVIVDVTFGKCFAREQELDSAFVAAASDLGYPDVHEMLGPIRKRIRPVLLSIILDERAKLGHCAH